MIELSAVGYAAVVAGALLVGFAKTAIGGVGLVSVALFAGAMPARESTGALLPLLLVGDVVAVLLYRRHAEWPALLRLVPSVALGVIAGAGFVAVVSDAVMRRSIGAVLLVLVAVHLVLRARGQQAEARPGRLAAPAFGTLAGFTTMVANAGGPVMSLYLLAARLDKMAFLGTASWFFLVVNASKLPFSVGLGLLRPETLLLDLALVPAVLLGAAAGRWIIGRIDQARFEQLVLAATVLASLNLVL